MCKCFKKSQLKKTQPYISTNYVKELFFLSDGLKEDLQSSMQWKNWSNFFLSSIWLSQNQLWAIDDWVTKAGWAHQWESKRDVTILSWRSILTMPLCQIEISISYDINDFFFVYEKSFFFLKWILIEIFYGKKCII